MARSTGTDTEFDPREHQAMVHALARSNAGRGVDFDDLVSEAYLAILQARKRFRPESGAKLSSYARPAVKGAIAEAICEQRGPMRVPGRYTWKALREGPGEAAAAARKALSAKVIGDGDASDDGEGPTPIADHRVSRDEFNSPETLVAMLALVAELPASESSYLRRRFGMEDAPALTVEKVAADLGITVGEAKEIEARLLATLRRRLDDLDYPASDRTLTDEETTTMSGKNRLNGHLGDKTRDVGTNGKAETWKCPSCGRPNKHSRRCYNPECEKFSLVRRKPTKTETTAADMAATIAPDALKAKAAMDEIEELSQITARIARLAPVTRDYYIGLLNRTFGSLR